MTAIRHLLVHVNDGESSREVLRLGAAMARQHGARLSARLTLAPLAPGAFVNAETASLAARLAQTERDTQQQRLQDLVSDITQATSLPIAASIGSGDAVHALVQAARGADLLLVGQHEAGQTGGLDAAAAARLLMAAGCPLLFVPHIGWAPAAADPLAPLQKVLVAWSDTRESARALRDALPLLQRARQVELITFVQADASGGESLPAGFETAAGFLRLHEVEPLCTVRHRPERSLGERMRRAWTPDASIAESLLSHAADTQAELIVMGGYGHPRAWELVLGGVTRTLLQTMTVPVLMSH